MERYHIFKLGIAILFYAAYCIRPMLVNGQKIDVSTNQTRKIKEEDLIFYQGVEGKPGVDFPTLSHIPRTSFNCRDVDSGYYADLETDCQVFHICEDNKKISFLCPNGTIFQQSELICEWWFKVNCTNSPNLYEESAEQLREDNARRKLSRRVQSHGAVMRTEERSSISARQNGRNLETGNGNKASKRVFVESEKRDKIDNHASTYRDELDQNNDLSRSPSSDFRDRSVNNVTPVPKQRQNEERKQNRGNSRNQSRGRKPVQFQQPPTINNEETPEGKTVASRTNRRKPNVNNEERNHLQQNSDSDKPSNNYNRQQSSFGKQEDHAKNYQQNFDRRKEKSFAVDQNGDYDSNKNTANNAFQETFGTTKPAFGSRSRGFVTYGTENKPASNNVNFQKETTVSSNNRGNTNANGFTQKTSFNYQSRGFTTTEKNDFQQSTLFDNQNQAVDSKRRDNVQQHNKVSTPSVDNFGTKQSIPNSFTNGQQSFGSGNYNHERNVGENKETNNFDSRRGGTTQTIKPTENDKFYSNAEEVKPVVNSSPNYKETVSFDDEYFSNKKQEVPLPSVSSINPNRQEPEFYTNDGKYTQDVNHQHDFGVSTSTQKSVVFGTNTNLKTSFQENQGGSFNTSPAKNFKLEATGSDQNQESTASSTKNDLGTSFTYKNHEESFNTNSDTNLNLEATDGGQIQSTFSPTKNDIINRRPESGDSDEAQITQETASFYKNSFNRIDQDRKPSSPNPYPNHRESYSELKEPKYYSTKTYSAISSVTPQYLTTQPINNGKPFIGSQVGTTFRSLSNVTTTTAAPTTSSLFNVGKTDRTFATFSTESPTTLNVETTELFNIGRTDKNLRPAVLATLTPFTPKPPLDLTVPSHGSFNVGTSTFKPKPESSTGKIIDHATVYGKFVKNSPTTPSSGKTISLSKSLFGDSVNPVTPRPLSLSTTEQTKFSSTIPTSGNTRILLGKSLFGGNVNGVTPSPFSKSNERKSSTVMSSAEILSAADSFNRGTPQVRFFGKVQTTTKIPGVEIHFNGNSVNSNGSPGSYNTFSTTPKPFSNSFDKTGTKILLGTNSFSGHSSTVGSTGTTPTSPSSSFRPELNSQSVSGFNSQFNSVTPTTNSVFSTTVNPEFNSVTPTTFSSGFDFDVTTRRPFGIKTSHPKFSGFFVTKSSENVPTQRSRIGDIVRPRPFQLPPEPDFGGKAVYTSTTVENNPTTPTPTYPTYKISSASPFADPSTPQPTIPTPFTTSKPTLPSTFENVDSMINALAEMANQNNFSDSPRPGLVIPPSAGPQTLHTLAVYFANALDGIAADKEEDEGEEVDEDEDYLTKKELEKKRLTELLTQMTMDRYNELFNDDKEVHETTTIASRFKSDDDTDLEGQHSKGPAQATPKVRQLAKVFTQALSSYLDDPATFRKVLEEVRPTEPPELENEENTDFGDDELLNFSDADSKSSYPPLYPTPVPVRPTWGYLIAYNTSQNIDIKNSLNPDLENLQGADSQSFVSQFNKLQNANKDNRELTTKSSLQLPEDHWTSSPDVNKLFKSAFSFDPASINSNFGTTEATTFTTEEPEQTRPIEDEHREIKYELRALPQLELNSTQVHGILIDFMNTTKTDEDNKLQRILRKLNTTQDEFLAKMKEIEENPLTRRLILLLINECGSDAQVDARAIPIHSLLSHDSNSEILETSSSIGGFAARQQSKNANYEIVDASLSDDSQDTRALQLLNSLYAIASRFGK